jgi:hypothetical protein
MRLRAKKQREDWDYPDSSARSWGRDGQWATRLNPTLHNGKGLQSCSFIPNVGLRRAAAGAGILWILCTQKPWYLSKCNAKPGEESETKLMKFYGDGLMAHVCWSCHHNFKRLFVSNQRIISMKVVQLEGSCKRIIWWPSNNWGRNTMSGLASIVHCRTTEVRSSTTELPNKHG